MSKKSKIYILVIVLVLVLLIIGSTFAYIIWNSNDSQRTAVVFTVDSNFSCRADVGGDISSNDAKIKPTTVSDKTKDNYIKREVKVNPILNLLDNDVSMDLWLVINELGSELSKSNNFMYSLTTSSNSNTEGVVVSGNFNGKKVGDKIILLDKREYLETTVETYYLWIWLDAAETNIKTAGQTFSLSLGGTCSEIERTYANLGGETDFYKTDTYREKITKVEFVNNMDIPSGSITFDLGAYPSKTDDVRGWLVSNGTDTYTLKIGSNDKIYAKSLAYTFYNMTNLKEITFDNLDTSETTNMSWMFYNCNKLTSLDLSKFNVSKVENFLCMFMYCGNLTSLNLSNWKTSSATNISGMFIGCSSLTSINVSDFDTSKVVAMESVFLSCRSLKTLDLSKWNTSKVTNMVSMFSDCSSLTNIYVSSLWNTSIVANSTNMFGSCSKLPNFNSSYVDKTNAHYNTGGYLTYKAA